MSATNTKLFIVMYFFGSTTTTYTTIASVHVLYCVGCCTCQNNSKNRQQSGCIHAIHAIHANVYMYLLRWSHYEVRHSLLSTYIHQGTVRRKCPYVQFACRTVLGGKKRCPYAQFACRTVLGGKKRCPCYKRVLVSADVLR